MSKLKVLIINDKGSGTGGVSIYVRTLKKLLLDRGYDVKVLSSDIYSKGDYPFYDYLFKGFKEESLARVVLYIFNPFSYFKLKKIIRDYKPDIIHLNNVLSQASPSICPLLNKVPSVMTIHGFSLICPFNKIDYMKKICNKKFGKQCYHCLNKKYPYFLIKHNLYKYFFKKLDKFVTVSNYLKKEFKKEGFDNIVTLHNKIPLLEFSEIKSNDLLYMGRLSNEKGIVYLINAMKKVLKYFPNIKLNVVGAGDEEDKLRDLVNKFNLRNNIYFIGELSHNKILEYYKKSAVVLIPSICPDSYPTVTMEAMSVGRPIIASRLGGLPEQIEEGKTGFLVPPRNPEAIAEKIIYLLKRPKLMQKMGLEGRKKAEKEFNINDYTKKIEELYKKVIKEHNKKL